MYSSGGARLPLSNAVFVIHRVIFPSLTSPYLDAFVQSSDLNLCNLKSYQQRSKLLGWSLTPTLQTANFRASGQRKQPATSALWQAKGKDQMGMLLKADLPCSMAAGSQTSLGNHRGGYPVPCGSALPSASGFRGKDHVSHTEPEPTGVNKKIPSPSPENVLHDPRGVPRWVAGWDPCREVSSLGSDLLNVTFLFSKAPLPHA